MEDSQPEAKIFSTRIVSMDYYIAAPIPDLDFCYSSFQGGKVNEVPVIRIYGPTPAGQKSCLHIHKALPYLYIPCGDLSSQPDQEGSALTETIFLAIEKALKLKGNAGSKRQHVHSCTLVRAKKFYGYHLSEELFMKIHLYHPQDISRVSNLLLEGVVLDKVLQPYESHIPFLLQFLIDYNLYGMGHIHLPKIKLRHPVPETYHSKRVFCNGSQGNVSEHVVGEPVWTFDTLPTDWMWPTCIPDEVPSGSDHSRVKRQSNTELEGDAVVEDILNQLLISYTPLSQSSSEVRMVQSLVPIWEEERERSGIHGLDVPPNSDKPLPEDVLRMLSHQHDLKNLVFETFGPITTSNASSEDRIKGPNEDQGTQMHPRNVQAFDQDALGLLKWLASSEAVEEINSDDELAHETILSPLLPTTTIATVLEKANTDFESLSQQECQDILDSVEDSFNDERASGGVSFSDDTGVSEDSLSNKMILQADGSSNDYKSSKFDGNSTFKLNSRSGMSERDDLASGHRSLTSCSKMKRRRYGSLPFSSSAGLNFSAPDSSNLISISNDDIKVQDNAEVIKSSHSVRHGNKEASTSSESSMRELMRKKRSYRTELPESRLSDIREVPSENEQGKDEILQVDQRNENVTNRPLASVMSNLTPTDVPVADSRSTICPTVVSNSLAPFLFPDENSKKVRSTVNEGSRPAIQMGNNHEMNIFLPGLKSSKLSGDSNLKADSCKLIGLTLGQKPPVIEFTSSLISNEALSLRPRFLDDLPPFFTGDHIKGDGHKSVSFSRDEYLVSGNNQGVVMGVPTHYQNDGSHLYILGPLFSPPSVESVKKWVSDQGTTSTIRKESPPNLSLDLADSQSSQAEVSESILSGSSSYLNKPSQHNKETRIEDLEPRQDVVKEVHHKTCCSQGMSQLSGPDSKSKLTPFSQIGFRDPASNGGTQQLTIMSIEVQAESRGDLRPNPQFDAINIIAIVIQSDDVPTSEPIILLRSSNESTRANIDGIQDCKVLVFSEEKLLFNHFVTVVSSFDPDMLMGWDVQGGSLGYLAERAIFLGIGLLNEVSRTPSSENVGSRRFQATGKDTNLLSKGVAAESVPLGDAIIDDEWGRTHASGVHVGGRVVLNIWRLMRNEVKLNLYTMEAVAEAVLRRKIPFIPYKVLTKWFMSGPGCAGYRCMEYTLERAKLNINIMDQLDMINRTSELARVFGIDFFSVLSRGSQYRVESMFLRLAHSQNYLAISPGSQQVACQPAMECLPLVMEPVSGFYQDPVVVLDFQSLYPSMIIAYNLCFSTCLGKILPSKENTLGVSSYSPDMDVLRRFKDELLITPNGVMYVSSKARKGILPRLLEELLSTRIMIKKAMKKLDPSQQVLHRVFNARQLALKLIANVTYGYTAAGFSGRMPCAELADSIVQCGRRTLENSISFVNNHEIWNAKVIYGDTDSMFVLLKGRSPEEAFKIGGEIAAEISAMNPDPVVLKMEKVYNPCFLLTKKRYVGYSYESSDQTKPKFDAKGIETVRRDTCEAVSKTMEQSLKLFFEHKHILKVKSYLLRQWRRIMSGRVSVQDFVFAKEVRLGTYSARASTLPPGAIIAAKAMKTDPRAEPRYAERIPYVVVHGVPGSRLVDMVVDPLELLAMDSPYRLNDVYYIKKQIIPALQRVFGLVGANLNNWYSELPRQGRRGSYSKRHLFSSNSHRTRIEYYYLSRHCVLCGGLVHSSLYLCPNCSACEANLATVFTGKTAKLEKDIQHLVAICRHCGGGDWLVESGVKCTSLACSVFYERRKVQKELQSVSSVATQAGFYPICMAELF